MATAAATVDPTQCAMDEWGQQSTVAKQQHRLASASEHGELVVCLVMIRELRRYSIRLYWTDGRGRSNEPAREKIELAQTTRCEGSSKY